jgi:hypothetical protein
MGKQTDQDEARQVGDRLAPPTTPDRDTIREDRAALDEAHDADRPPTPDEEAAAERAGGVDPKVASSYKDAMERGAAQKGEGKPGV